MKLVFVCSPYRGDVETNVANAKRYCKLVAACGYVPIAPHLIFPQFLSDEDEAERLKGINMGLELLKKCSEMWVFANSETEGMKFEIAKAKELGMPVRFHDSEMDLINYETVEIDGRLSASLKSLIKRIVGGK